MALDRNKRADFIKRDEDVLDTWFSSALWPFSTLGWPDDTPEVKRYYPTDVLVTGFDIIFFWVARMMMMGLHFMKEAPFSTVYIHRLVRDEKGAKMSKSKGNVIDPARYHRRLRRRCAALRAGARRGAGPRHQAVAAAGRDQPQFRDQAVERVPLCRDERLREARWLRSARDQGYAQPLDRSRNRAGHARGDGSARCLSLQRCVQRDLPFRLERLLRLVSRALQADVAGRGGCGEGRDPRHGGLGARRDFEAAASLHALHHRGAVGSHRPPRHAAGAVAVVGQLRFLRRCSRSRNRLGDRPRHLDSLGARRDEHWTGYSAGARRRLRGNQSAGSALGRRHQATGAPFRHLLRRSGA